MEELREKVKTAESKEEYEELKEKYTETKNEYVALRYKDCREFSDRGQIWRDSFLQHLKGKQLKNPRRIVCSAFDVLLSYEKITNSRVSFSQLIDTKVLRKILINFRDNYKASYASKVKYVFQFGKLIRFLILDADSPERNSGSDLLVRGFKLEETKNEIQNEIDLLKKLKGKQMISTKMRAKEKLILSLIHI